MSEEELISQLFLHCRQIISSTVAVEDGIKSIKEITDKDKNGALVLFDVLTALDIECGSNSNSNINFRKLLLSIMNDIIPAEILNLELNALEAEDKTTKSRIVKSRTRIYYKQVKFNLLREENEGYAKFITEVLTTKLNADQVILIVERLIGQFNLDPNRVVDVILDCFEQNISERELFINILKKFKIHRDELLHILLLKFVFCENFGYTPMDIYRVASILCQADLIDMRSLFAMISPFQEQIIEENKSLNLIIKKRATKAETISTGSLADSSLANAATAMLVNDIVAINAPEPSTSNVSTISFEAAYLSQNAEDKKIAGNLFDDTEVLAKNQKLGLVCAFLEHGAWSYAKQLLDRLPEEYTLGRSKRICSAIANIVGYAIEQFYKKKYLHWRESAHKSHDSWRKFTYPAEQVTKWEDLVSIVLPLLNYLGPYLTVRHEVAIKLIRLIVLFFDDEEAKLLPNYETLSNAIMDICDMVLVPGSSLLESNFAYCEEIWLVLQRFTTEQRYRIYGRWKNLHTNRCWDLFVQRGKVLGMTRFAMKRLSKDNAKLIGRQLGKLCHTMPLVVLDYMLDKVQDFQNFISPVVDSMRFLSNMGFDVLSYCLIENLSNPEKAHFKLSDAIYSPWLISLSNFSAAIYRRYSIDFTGLLQYITNQLKDGNNLDLIVLREIVSNISGVESSTDLTQEHLEGLCGGEYLRQEAAYSSLTKINRRAVSRLKDALLKNELFKSLCILISQQKNFIVFKESKEYPLKLTTYMLDQCQETFVQFFYFLRGNLKFEEYAKNIPSVSLIITNYHMPIEAAMCLTRLIYLNRINTAYETAKKNFKEDGKKVDDTKLKLNDVHKASLYNNAFQTVMNSLEEELNSAFPEAFWLDITSKLYATFWLLSVNDLSAPISAYKREIEKCKRELVETMHYTSDSVSKLRRNAKDEERLKNLEQKLSEELRKQTEHAERIEKILTMHKEDFFASSQNRTSQMLRFLQCCILPRAVFSEVDAVYCAKFIQTLHVVRTGFFQTIVFFDKIFTDVTPILAGLTERETNCFGRFCCMCLDLILRWHSDAAIFKKECEGYPGCITKIRKRDSEESSNTDAFSYEYYRSICYKWQTRLGKSLTFMLSSSNYVLVRNGLTLMTKILPNFPILTSTVKLMEKTVTTLRENEKGKRLDLNLLASSYLVQLTKRNVFVFEAKDFFNSKLTKSVVSSTTPATKPVAEKQDANATLNRKRQVIFDQKVSNVSEVSEEHQVLAKKKVRDH